MKVRIYIGVIGSGKDYRAQNECDLKLAFADGVREDVWKNFRMRTKNCIRP